MDNKSVEKQAREYAKAYFPEQEYIDKYMLGKKSGYIRGFIQGAEWQARQSPWINVEERLPEENTGVFFTVEWKDSRKGYFVGLYYGNGQWESEHRIFLKDSPLYRITHYIPIHTFDQILEANKDVLQRMKEK